LEGQIRTFIAWLRAGCKCESQGGSLPTDAEIDKAAEQIVVEWLSEKGYFTNVATRLPGSTEIEAIGRDRKLLVLVKSSLLPYAPATMTGEEEGKIRARAAGLAYQPWEARVLLDTQLELAIEIQWRALAQERQREGS
jgi:hypothetical protein